MSKKTSSRADGKSSKTTGLTRALSSRVEALRRQGKLPPPGAVFRAMSLAAEEILAEHGAHAEPSQLEREESKPQATVYLSPSVRENSTVEQAKDAYLGSDHRKQVELANRVGYGARAGIGVWADGAEESTAFYADPGKAEKAAALVAAKANQKSTLVFSPRDGGNATRYAVSYPATSFDKAVAAFNDAGVPFHTHFPGKEHGTAELTHVVSDDKDLPAKIASAAEKLGGKVDTEVGDMKFLGHDTDRAAAKREFLRILGGRSAAR